MTPRDVDALTVMEYDDLAAALDAYAAEHRRQALEAEARMRARDATGR